MIYKHICDVMHGSFCFTHQLRVIVLFSSPAFLASLISHLRVCIQDLLQLVMVGRAVPVHQPVKGLLCRFILEKQTTFIPEWNKEKHERVEVVLSLILLLRIKQLDWKTWLFELGIMPLSVIISTLPRVVGHQVVETDVFQTLRSLGIVCIQ